MSRYEVVEAPFIECAGNFLLRQFLTSARPRRKQDIVDFAQGIDLSYDQTSSATGKMVLRPYQVEPLRESDNPDCQQVTLMWSQRLGKSTIARISMMKRIADGEGFSGLMVMPSEVMASRAMEDTVKPLLCRIPSVRQDWAVRGNVKKDGIHLPSSNAVLYILGASNQIIGYTASWTYMDEIDFAQTVQQEAEQKNMDNIKALRLRMRTFRRRMMILCSSPTTAGGAINTEWKAGSQGVWNWRCLHCGELSPTDKFAFFHEDGWRGLQWQKDDNGLIVPDSVVWICPHCGHVHHQEDATEMNRLGCYEHGKPMQVQHRSFQAGALAASPDLWTWKELAECQENATDADGKKFLYNTCFSRPYVHRKENDLSIEDSVTAKQSRFPDDMADRIAMVLGSADQQASIEGHHKYFTAVVRAWFDDGSSHMLESRTCNTLEELGSMMEARYFGHKVAMCLVDSGGFEIESDLLPFVRSKSYMFLYKGTSSSKIDGKDWVKSSTEAKMFLVSALTYQIRLLTEMYATTPNRWWLPEHPDPTYLQQLMAMRPNTRQTKDMNGMSFENWCANSERKDFWDAEKMQMACFDIACSVFPATAFPAGHKPSAWVREQVLRLARRRKIGR